MEAQNAAERKAVLEADIKNLRAARKALELAREKAGKVGYKEFHGTMKSIDFALAMIRIDEGALREELDPDFKEWMKDVHAAADHAHLLRRKKACEAEKERLVRQAEELHAKELEQADTYFSQKA